MKNICDCCYEESRYIKTCKYNHKICKNCSEKFDNNCMFCNPLRENILNNQLNNPSIFNHFLIFFINTYFNFYFENLNLIFFNYFFDILNTDNRFNYRQHFNFYFSFIIFFLIFYYKYNISNLIQ